MLIQQVGATDSVDSPGHWRKRGAIRLFADNGLMELLPLSAPMDQAGRTVCESVQRRHIAPASKRG